MNRRIIQSGLILITMLCLLPWRTIAEPILPQQSTIAFATIDVIIETSTTPLAAYQLEIAASQESIRFVGIEGGAADVFRDPPYYDPAAMQQERVIIADFSNAASAQLPSGSVLIARLHVQYDPTAPLEFNSELMVAATTDGHAIDGAQLRVTPVTD